MSITYLSCTEEDVLEQSDPLQLFRPCEAASKQIRDLSKEKRQHSNGPKTQETASKICLVDSGYAPSFNLGDPLHRSKVSSWGPDKSTSGTIDDKA